MDYIDIGSRGEGGRATYTGIILCQAVDMDYIDIGSRGREGEQHIQGLYYVKL